MWHSVCVVRSGHGSIGFIIVGKDTNSKWVSQYDQASTGMSFDTVDSWVGGDNCASTSTTAHAVTTTSRAANYGWVFLGNGCYQAQGGVTLSGLAVVTAISYAQLAAINNMGNPNYVVIGQVVCTTQQSKTGDGSPPVSSGYNCTYTVQSGNALSVIAQTYGVSKSALAAANGISNVNDIQIGQVLKVPCTKGGASAGSNSGSGSSSTPAPVTNKTSPFYGYFPVGYKYGIKVYVPAIPKQWGWGKIPYVIPFSDQCAWKYIGHTKYASNGGLVKSQYTVASYNQNGTWTGQWAVITTPVGSAPWTDSCTPSVNWPYLV